MTGTLRRAARLTLSPDTEWQSIAAEPADEGGPVRTFVLSLALIPAVSWCIGLAVSGHSPVADAASIAHKGATAYAGSIVSIYLLALSIYVLAPMFAPRRDWKRSFKAAAYCSAPVLLAGPLLVIPDLAFALLIAVFHSFYLLYAGMRLMLGVKEDQAAEYVALVVVLLSVVSVILGTFGSAVGIL